MRRPWATARMQVRATAWRWARVRSPTGSTACRLAMPAANARSPTWPRAPRTRSEEHTSELQSLKRISYAFFCLKKKTKHIRRVYENITVTHIQINYIEFHDISIYEQQLYL